MKIWYHSNTGYRYDTAMEGYGRNLEEQCKRAARPDTEIFVSGVPVHGEHVDRFRSIMYFHAQQCVNNMLKAEKEGYDAFVIGCSYDPGMEIGREMLNIPVVAIGHANLCMAVMLGELFAIVTCEPWFAEKYRQLVRNYGLQAKHLPGNYTVPVSELEMARALKDGDPKPIALKFKAVAKRAVADGASVIIPIPPHISQILRASGISSNLDGATILDPVSVVVKVTEMMVDLKKLGIDVSRTPLVYGSPGKALLKKTLKTYAPVFKIDY